ncbi:MAG: LysR family transcriptional regulator substrate-binding protein [Clostridia bacterium]|nr:LysR family transcriptional regulator substrate-binding protein [Clostridia bacterium]
MHLAERELFLAARRDARPVGQAGRAEIDLADFANAPFILLKKGRGIRRMADRLFEKSGFQPLIAYETSSYNMALGLAAQGLGCTFVIDHEMRLPENMAAYHILGAEETYQLHLVCRKDIYLTRPFQYFIELAKRIDRREALE